MSWTDPQTLATLRDVDELGIPQQALAMKPPAEKLRALQAASGLFTARLRKRYEPPLAIRGSAWLVLAAVGLATYEGSPAITGSAADVRIEIVTGGTVASGLVTTRVSLQNGATGTWGATTALPVTGLVTVGDVLVTLSGTWATGEAVTFSTGSDPAVRASVAAWAAWLMINNRGADPKTLELLKGPYETAKAFAEDLAKGEKAELPQSVDSTPNRSEGGPRYVENTRDGFLYPDRNTIGNYRGQWW